MQVRYRYRIYPSPGQQQALARAFGCARVVYNDCLRVRDACHAAGEKISGTEVQRRVVTLAKATPQRAWLAEVASVALVQACQDARRAYKNWFGSMSGRRKGPKIRHPKPRRKHGRQSVRLTRNGFALHGERLYVAKVGDIKVAWSRRLPSVPSSVTVIRRAGGIPVVHGEEDVNFGDETSADTRSEEIVGQWLSSRPQDVRDQVVVATKGRFPTGTGPNDVGLSRKHLTAALDASLRRLGVPVIDLYQMHAWDPLTPLEETLGFLDDIQRAGKAHYVGLSNFIGWQLQKSMDVSGFRGWARPVTLQQQYNLLTREIEWEVLPVCLNEELGLLPWSPLGGGWLTGKYQRDSEPAGATRLGEGNRNGVEALARRAPQQRTWDVVAAVSKVAGERGVSPAQVALAWVHDRPAVTAPVLGARTVEQLKDNLGAAGLHLSAEETSLLDEASAPDAPDYPYGPSGRKQRSRPVRGGRAT